MKLVIFHRTPDSQKSDVINPDINSTWKSAYSNISFENNKLKMELDLLTTVQRESKSPLIVEGHYTGSTFLSPWTYKSIRIRPEPKILVFPTRLSFKDAFSPIAPIMEKDYFGQILCTTDTALVYIRGNVDDIPGYENVHVAKHEASDKAFIRYSAEADCFLKIISAKKNFFAGLDPFNSLSWMEAQLDLLTELVLASGISPDSKQAQFLARAREASCLKGLTDAEIGKRMREKGDFRAQQQKYFNEKAEYVARLNDLSFEVLHGQAEESLRRQIDEEERTKRPEQPA